MPIEEIVRSSIVLFGLALVASVVLACRGRPWTSAVAVALLLWPGWRLAHALALGWPLGPREVSLLRATLALAALTAVARETFAPRRWPASRATVLSTLALCAAGSMAAFYNLGHPQFWDAKNVRPGFVHNHDMRVYYPVAKYFRELRYDGVYLASALAYLDDLPGSSRSAIQLRDLRTHEMRRFSDVEPEAAAVRRRFTEPRWREFTEDMRYFRETMGNRVYLDTLSDHGANATPVWIMIARLLFGHTRAGNTTLLAGALLDPLLLLIALLAIGRCFGLRTALVCAVVFGANDFYLFGSSWAGATLRHDWLAFAALGVCALKAGWWRAGGALLALSAMLRAFPALALVGAALPGLWSLGEDVYTRRRLLSWKELVVAHKALGRIVLGAAACAAACGIFSMFVLPADAWGQWIRKVVLLNGGAYVNHVSLRTLVAGNDALQATTLWARWPLFVVLLAGFVILVALAARGRTHAQGALLGLLLIPIVLNPANYYIHFIFLIPMLACETDRGLSRHEFALWAILLGLCVVQYWTTLVPGWPLHFELATLLYFLAMGGLLVTLAAARRRTDRSLDIAPTFPGLRVAIGGGSRPPRNDRALTDRKTGR